MFPLSTLITKRFSHAKYVTTTFFPKLKLKIVVFYNSKVEYMLPLVTLITKRFSEVKLSLNSQGWLSFAKASCKFRKEKLKENAVNGV